MKKDTYIQPETFTIELSQEASVMTYVSGEIQSIPWEEA